MTRFAVSDAYPTEQEEARQLVASCAECAALANDIRLISASVARDLPRPVRNRDFTISAEQAEKLSGSPLSRWLRTLSTPGWATLRPVAGVALSIGLVMAVVGSALPNQRPILDDVGNRVGAPANDTSAPQLPPEQPNAAGQPSEAPDLVPGQGPTSADPAMEVFAQASPDQITREMDNAYVVPSPEGGAEAPTARAADELRATADPARDLLIYAGLAVAVLSLGLLLLAWAARRYFTDPLLR